MAFKKHKNKEKRGITKFFLTLNLVMPTNHILGAFPYIQ